MKRIKVISLDYDGVIVSQINTWGLIREIRGIPEGRLEEYTKGIINGKGFRDTEHVLFKKNNLKYEDFIEAGNQEKLHPNVKETIQQLYERDYVLFINSAGPRPTILTVLRRWNPQPFKYVFSMIPLFDVNNVFYDTFLPFEDMNHDVDKVRVLQEVAQREEIPIESIVHVGDGVTDIACFKVCIGISFNSHSKKVVQSAKYNLENFKDLIPLLEKINS
ncbi:MAG TPA: haloacid dehalogenase-like hydrolase [Candidatus Deferrimicrobium sp.]|nr:haloacid dehalogenase-like hydrolase [Candidatus Deferrimicrobium sp.]